MDDSIPTNQLYYNKAVLTYKALNNLTPAYISQLLTPTAIAYNSQKMAHWSYQKPGRLFTSAHLQFQPLRYVEHFAYII